MLNENSKEIIFVGLPGPTHNYGGLSADNVASSTNRGKVASPKEAALQALELIRVLKSLGVEAGILPPQLRPHLGMLRTRFSGSDEAIITEAAQKDPTFLEKACSSSAMWTANAATVGVAADSKDGKLHLTTANLQTNLHRRIEAEDTHRVLSAIFKNLPDTLVHAPLPPNLRDEGAANHMRLTPTHGACGLNIYVYGTDGGKNDPESARQTLAASQAVAKSHGIINALFLKQHPDLIRQGVFHNDVIGVANEHVLLAHELAFADPEAFETIEDQYFDVHDESPIIMRIRAASLSVEEAVRTYFFNSQMVSTKGGMVIIAPTEVKELYGGKAAKLMEKIAADHNNPISDVRYANLRQSMNNGGGPACLRLRVPMNAAQLSAIKKNVNVMADEKLLADMARLIETHYPERVIAEDLAHIKLYDTCKAALSEMAVLMKLPIVEQ